MVVMAFQAFGNGFYASIDKIILENSFSVECKTKKIFLKLGFSKEFLKVKFFFTFDQFLLSNSLEKCYNCCKNGYKIENKLNFTDTKQVTE